MLVNVPLGRIRARATLDPRTSPVTVDTSSSSALPQSARCSHVRKEVSGMKQPRNAPNVPPSVFTYPRINSSARVTNVPLTTLLRVNVSPVPSMRQYYPMNVSALKISLWVPPRIPVYPVPQRPRPPKSSAASATMRLYSGPKQRGRASRVQESGRLWVGLPSPARLGEPPFASVREQTTSLTASRCLVSPALQRPWR